MKIIGILFSLLAVTSYSAAEVDDQLWVMIKMDTSFRTVNELRVVDQVTDLIERANLGSLDGHSSGAYQFDFNYYEVSNFDGAKSRIQIFMAKHYPDIVFTISND